MKRVKEHNCEILWDVATAGDTNRLAGVLRKNIDIDVANTHGITALMRAAAAGKTQMVRLLLEHGADPNRSRNDGFTPLMLAAFFGHKDVVSTLIEHGANKAAASRFGTSARMWASARTCTEVADYLKKSDQPQRITANKPASHVPAEMPSVANDKIEIKQPFKFNTRLAVACGVFVLLTGIVTATSMAWLRKPSPAPPPVINHATIDETKAVVNDSPRHEETLVTSREPEAPQTSAGNEDREQVTSTTRAIVRPPVKTSNSAHVQPVRANRVSAEKFDPPTRPLVTTDVVATSTQVVQVKKRTSTPRALAPPSSLLVSPSKGSAKSGKVIAWP